MQTRSNAELLEANRLFYNPLWADTKLVAPERFNTWDLVSSLLADGQQRLEVAPGLRPRLPLAGTRFVDISTSAVEKLRANGADATTGLVSALPHGDAAFTLVCALDIVEHVADDQAALAELARVVAPGGILLISAPLHPECWTAFDDFVGHFRRYEPAALVDLLKKNGFTVEQSAVYGMQPKSSRLLDLGMWFLTHHRERAMWWYNHVFMPMGVRSQKTLQLSAGMRDATGVDEMLLVCRKGESSLPV